MEEKDLEKLTATKLREIAKQYEDITGTHAMKKDELIVAIRRARGEDITTVHGKDVSKKITELKQIMQKLRDEKQTAREKKDKKAVTHLRRRIKKYRRVTRKMARSKV
nr:Rho termination factor N-terminal domain-containing protein [Deltaproteobacteria bacterium]